MANPVAIFDQSRVNERFRQFLLWDIVVCAVWSVAMLALYVIFSTAIFLVMLIEIVLYTGVLLVAKYLVERGNRDLAITLMAFGLWALTASLAIFAPVTVPAIVLLMVLSVMVALPLVTGRTLLLLIVGAIVVSSSTAGSQLADGLFDLSAVPEWIIVGGLMVAVLATTGLIFLLLWQYSSRLTDTITTIRETNEQLQSEIAERRRAEMELRRINSQLEVAMQELRDVQGMIVQQERMRALGQMASGVAHDFNNALVPIVTYTDLLIMVPSLLDDKEELTSYLQTISTAAKDATGVVRRLREFYRTPEPGMDFVRVDLAQVVEQSISLTQPRWLDQARMENIAITIETDLQPVRPIRGSESEMRESLTNLIMNACDAMPDGGTITISTRLDREDVILAVADNGIGMSEEDRLRCMDPFFSTKGDRGTGMGLAMVFGIIQRHKGTIEVESGLGKGTKFVMRLPVGTVTEPVDIIQEPEAVGVVLPLHILAVDDDLVSLKALTDYLRTDGHSVETAADGVEGLEKFRSGTFDLVVTDRAMPNMNGDAFALAIKEVAPEKGVLMLTGFGDIMQATDEVPPGVDLIRSKPISLIELRAALARIVNDGNPEEKGNDSG